MSTLEKFDLFLIFLFTTLFYYFWIKIVFFIYNLISEILKLLANDKVID